MNSARGRGHGDPAGPLHRPVADDESAAAKQLAAIFGVEWGKAAIGPFATVYVNEGLTLDWEVLTVSYARPRLPPDT